MPYTPTPILFGQTPPDGVLLDVTADRGGLAGYVLMNVTGPPATVRINGAAVTYPVTLSPGDVLHLQRGPGQGVTSIQALAPIDNGEAPQPTNLIVNQAPDGTLSSTDSRITTNPDGSLSAPDTLVTVNPDGSLSEV